MMYRFTVLIRCVFAMTFASLFQLLEVFASAREAGVGRGGRLETSDERVGEIGDGVGSNEMRSPGLECTFEMPHTVAGLSDGVRSSHKEGGEEQGEGGLDVHSCVMGRLSVAVCAQEWAAM